MVSQFTSASGLIVLMEVTEKDLELLKRFKTGLGAYHDLANSVFGVSRGYERMSDSDFKKLRIREREARDSLNELYGSVEKLIINLLGGKPFMAVPAVPGARWDVFTEALSSSFNISKGECLNYAVDAMNRAYGKAKSLVGKPEQTPKKVTSEWFSKDLLVRISDQKTRTLCKELNGVAIDSPNAAALLMRTILLITLQKKIGKLAKDDLGPVLNQAISQDIYKDLHIKRILTNLASVPKTMLDATHHSKWALIKQDDIGVWMPGLVNVVEATYPEK